MYLPIPPAPQEIPNCAETGVLGVLPGIIGNLMALEAIKVLAGLGKPLSNKLLLFNSLDTQFQELEIQPNPANQSALPASWNEFHQRDYTSAFEGIQQLTWNEAMKLMGQEVAFVDVREPGGRTPSGMHGIGEGPIFHAPQ